MMVVPRGPITGVVAQLGTSQSTSLSTGPSLDPFKPLEVVEGVQLQEMAVPVLLSSTTQVSIRTKD